MFDPEIAALLGALIGKFPDDAAELDAATRGHAVRKWLEPACKESACKELARKDGTSVDDFTQAGRKASRLVPTMWR